MEQKKSGYIYVLTNESFHRDNWIKIGYAEDIDKRVKDLSGTSVPLPFKVYCTYEIPRLSGVKDPDKLVHDLIQLLNPDLRITPNREFFEILPWDAYNMLFAIAQLHGRTDKLVRNSDNAAGENDQNDSEYTIEALFVDYKSPTSLFAKIKEIILSIDNHLEIVPRRNYVAFKLKNKNVVSLWPRANSIEVVLNAKQGTITDTHNMTYDITNRKWTSEQYAFKFNDETNITDAKDLITETYKLKL